MQSGTLKAVVPDKGFGFIEQTGNVDVFLNFKVTANDLNFGSHLIGNKSKLAAVAAGNAGAGG